MDTTITEQELSELEALASPEGKGRLYAVNGPKWAPVPPTPGQKGDLYRLRPEEAAFSAAMTSLGTRLLADLRILRYERDSLVPALQAEAGFQRDYWSRLMPKLGSGHEAYLAGYARAIEDIAAIRADGGILAKTFQMQREATALGIPEEPKHELEEQDEMYGREDEGDA